MTPLQPQLLENDHWQIGILSQTGGSIAYARLKHQGHWADFMRPTSESSYGSAPDCASFILIPWASRIAGSEFTFRGIPYKLRSNSKEGWAIHGIGRDYPWHVQAADREHTALRFNSADYTDANFPFRFSARLEYALQDNCFIITTSLKNEDTRAMPGGFGHHPYFQRSLTDQPDDVQLEIPCTQFMDLSTGVPIKAPELLPQRLDFTQLRALGTANIDDCLTGRIDSRPIRIVYPQAGREIVFHADDLFKIIVFYAPPGEEYFAVEPLTLATDAFNLYEKNIPGSGVFVLEPGEEKSGTMYFEAR
jgi:aldose 1-epimerase